MCSELIWTYFWYQCGFVCSFPSRPDQKFSHTELLSYSVENMNVCSGMLYCRCAVLIHWFFQETPYSNNNNNKTLGEFKLILPQFLVMAKGAIRILLLFEKRREKKQSLAEFMELYFEKSSFFAKTKQT